MRHLVCLPLVLVLACDGGEDPDGTDTGETDSGSPTETDDTAEVDCRDQVPTEGARLEGDVVDTSGAPITEGLRVQYCRGDQCLVACFVEGEYVFGGLDAGAGSLELVPLGDSDLATAFVPVTVGDSGSTGVDVTVPTLGAAITLAGTPAEVEPVTGLFITLGDASLTPPPLKDPATEIAGVDATAHAPPIDSLEGTVEALYYLDPFDYPAVGCDDDDEGTACETLPVRVDDAWTLGTEGELWRADYYTAQWIKIGDLVDDGDGKLEAVEGLDRISTLAVVRKPAP